MKSLKAFIGILILSVVMTGSGYAQTAGGKIAFVDLSRVFDEYGKTKEFDAVLEKKHAAFVQEHKDKEQKIKDGDARLALLKNDEKAKLQAQLDKDKQDLLMFDKQVQGDLTKERNEKIRDILSEIEKIVKDYAAKNNYSLILNDRVLIFGDPTMDITNPITKILNDKFTPPKSK